MDSEIIIGESNVKQEVLLEGSSTLIRRFRFSALTTRFAARRSVLFLSAAMAVSSISIGTAKADALYRTEYEISMFGLSLARAAIETTVKGRNYSVNGRFMTSGLARIFDDTDGNVRVNGRSVVGRAVPRNFNLTYQHGRKNKSTTIGFASGNVIDVSNVPPVKKREPWIAVTPDDLLNVSDPISAMMITAQDAISVCNRTLNVFDGQTRADIKLSFSGTSSFTTRGFTGESVVCSAKFLPLSGYQEGRKAINYLSNRSRLTISFASMGDSGIYAPVLASIGTQLGTLKIQATRFEQIR